MPYAATKRQLIDILSEFTPLPAIPESCPYPSNGGHPSNGGPALDDVSPTSTKIEMPDGVVIILVQIEAYLRIKILKGSKLVDDFKLESFTGWTSASTLIEFADYILLKLKDSLVEKIAALSPGDKKLVAQFVESISAPSTAAPLLERQIAEFPDRPDRSVDIIQYINQQWKGVLSGTFTRADLRKKWPRTEQALRNYERKHGHTPLDVLNLPTVQQRNEMWVKHGRIEELKARPTLSRAELSQCRTLENIRSRMRAKNAPITLGR